MSMSSTATVRDLPQGMPTDISGLASLAAEYAQGMTSIRGRRVQRLLKREFAGARYVYIVGIASGGSGVLGLSKSGAGFIATDGRGPHACVSKWLHGSKEATEVRFDLLKDSLPVLGSKTIPFTALRPAPSRTLETMEPLRHATVADASAVSTWVCASFNRHVAADWELAAQSHFHEENQADKLASKIADASLCLVIEQGTELLGASICLVRRSSSCSSSRLVICAVASGAGCGARRAPSSSSITRT